MPKQIAYSDSELRLLAIIKKRGIADTNTLTEDFYKGLKAPLNARMTVADKLRGLKRKMVFNKDKQRLFSSERIGPHPIKWWVKG